MELLSKARPFKLRKFLTPVLPSLPAPFRSNASSVSHLNACKGFNIIAKQPKFVKKIVAESIICFFNTEQDEEGIVLLFDLMYSWNSRDPYYGQLKASLSESQFERLVIVRDIMDYSQLVQALKQLKSYTYFQSVDLPFDYLSKRLALVVLDNISIFCWKFKSTDAYPMEYLALSTIINSLEQQYGCFFIITTFDKAYDMGLDLSATENTLQSITSLPVEFFSMRFVYNITSNNNYNGLLNGKLFDNIEKKTYMIREGTLKS